MEIAATAVGRRYAVADIITGGLVLAVVTSLPNAVSAVYLARRGRGAAVLSTALNSNAINVVGGLLIPASLAGFGPGSGQDTLVAAWYTGLTVVALALAYRGRGLGRSSGTAIIAGYVAFVTALVITVEQGGVRPAAAVLPGRRHRRGRRAAADLAGPVADCTRRPGRTVAARVGAARMEHRPPVAAQPHLVRRGGGFGRGERPAPDPDRPADRRPVLCAADRPVSADRRGQRLRRDARSRARRARSDLRDRHPVHVPGRRRNRRNDRHRLRGSPPAPASMIAIRIGCNCCSPDRHSTDLATIHTLLSAQCAGHPDDRRSLASDGLCLALALPSPWPRAHRSHERNPHPRRHVWRRPHHDPLVPRERGSLVHVRSETAATGAVVHIGWWWRAGKPGRHPSGGPSRRGQRQHGVETRPCSR
jgi:hypothetical protein